MHRATAELIATGKALNAKKAGDKAPEFALKDPDGRSVSSGELLAKGPLVVSFYRGVWCPYCSLELRAFQETLPQIEVRGASVVAISPQTAANSRKSQRDNKLSDCACARATLARTEASPVCAEIASVSVPTPAL